MTDQFKDVMARFPTGVTIATTTDRDGTPHGLTISSFCSVSLEPPLVLACVAKSATCHPVFARTGRFAISILHQDQSDLALRFADRTARKFGGGGFLRTDRGNVVVADALATLECTVHSRHDGGDHTILVGEVVGQTLAAEGAPVVYVDRRFAALAPTS
ncbi:flavin reductase family protein [Kitasatospora sp. NPDC059146]|uniref:flavin reductase family protein n=1 Tax=unclassified Kitasatospora TaxID=2633591 RepID=UPI0035E0E6BB